MYADNLLTQHFVTLCMDQKTEYDGMLVQHSQHFHNCWHGGGQQDVWGGGGVIQQDNSISN